ncbi:UDP-N-acetylglucosamine 2-epimerase, partial [Staphylococcus haemolyticus]|uniref:UDP-N-acetylglucosamine 2-epimerase n=1 Tax=Staphylococcus haemolyticus TaxID=1283 RepID=UPI0030BF6863
VRDDYESTVMNRHPGQRVILLTAHRRENIGEPMRNIFQAVKNIVDDHSDVTVVYPVHKNPKVRELADKYLGQHDRIELVEP